MAKRDKHKETMGRPNARKPNEPTLEEVEAIFADVDETGHTNASKARHERSRRRARKAAVEIDPLSGEDPSGSNVSKVMTRAAIGVLIVLLLGVILSQVACGVARRLGTAKLAESVNVKNVANALRNGVEWGDGFTQFPSDFSVQEADENTGRIEVTVVDTSSKNEMESLSGSQIQAAALAVNALMNPNINQVIFHVNVHVDADGKFQQSTLFGFLKPTGNVKQFATFIWTKSATASGGVNFNCTITGLDASSAENLRSKLVVQNGLLDVIAGSASTEAATTGAPAASSTADAETGAAKTDGGHSDATDAQPTAAADAQALATDGASADAQAPATAN